MTNEITSETVEFEIDGNMGYDFADVDSWVSDAVEYINLLQDALNRAAGLLYVHGWREDDAKVQRGKELRQNLGIKGSGESEPGRSPAKREVGE